MFGRSKPHFRHEGKIKIPTSFPNNTYKNFFFAFISFFGFFLFFFFGFFFWGFYFFLEFIFFWILFFVLGFFEDMKQSLFGFAF